MRFYEVPCSCRLRYIGETKRNSEVHWKEHKYPAGKSKPAKHLIELEVLSAAFSYFRRGKIMEAFFVALRKPALNVQLERHSLSLFRHGIT